MMQIFPSFKYFEFEVASDYWYGERKGLARMMIHPAL
jgi:hypothetical protein